MFRFVILGAAKIAPKFVKAARLTGEADVVAVASKSAERAEAFTEENAVARWYDDYARMLDEEKPDCAYIATTPNFHYPLTMLCLEKGIPVICEKAMFLNADEARKAFAFAKKKGLFLMEAMWSRFLPATQTLKAWVEEGKIGHIESVRCQIGFHVPEGDDNRYRAKALGGGAARDILVYAFEQTDYVLGMQAKSFRTQTIWGPTGVDMTDHVSILYEKNGERTLANLVTSFEVKMNDELVLYGEKGKLVMPGPHIASSVYRYDNRGQLVESFEDTETENGFVYEIREVMKCIREGRIESEVEPADTTVRCAELFDRLDTEQQ